jgi:glycosyltransferase involved in cell wall biosynthesis
MQQAQERIDLICKKLMSLGFTDRPLAELSGVIQTSPNRAERAAAACQLAIWHMRGRSDEGCHLALDFLARARRDASDLAFRRKLVKVELMCQQFLGGEKEGYATYERAALAGEVTADAMLAWGNFQSTPEGRLAWINEVLKSYGIAPVALLPGEERSPYDRLTVVEPLQSIAEGPKVTVLLAAYNAAAMIPTALRSLQEQTWRNIEVIVLDDCSPTGDMAAVVERVTAKDPRFRLIRMEVNRGAYVARNCGLQEATGTYVTLHDADDWSHPSKIETQVRFMEANSTAIGCTSQQARTLEDLTFAQLRGGSSFVTMNTSSFMFRRKPIQDALGCWDTVRFSADSELIRRMQKVWGKASWARIQTGPLSFQRDAESSITSNPIKGLEWGYPYYGVRKEYYDAQRYHHDTAPSLRYDGDSARRPFTVPPMMLPEQDGTEKPPVLDVVFAGDFRRATPAVAALVDEVAALTEGREPGRARRGTELCRGPRRRDPHARLPSSAGRRRVRARPDLWRSGPDPGICR